jgi:hypothetical protein
MDQEGGFEDQLSNEQRRFCGWLKTIKRLSADAERGTVQICFILIQRTSRPLEKPVFPEIRYNSGAGGHTCVRRPSQKFHPQNPS